ncbi:MAG: hypothetical protein IPP48_01350 [Chitinophagaceae bacterium]|nr:hypothetical protein [Chitinophagaceae bacterium]
MGFTSFSHCVTFGYFKLFYKTYNVSAVAKNADAIVALDVKRITTL